MKWSLKGRFLSCLYVLTAMALSCTAIPDSLAAPQEPKVKTGKIAEGKKYTSGRGLFSITVPLAGNPFVRTYAMQESELKAGNYDYEEVVFQIADFGQAFGAGVRRIPQSVVDQMAKEEMAQTLSNLSWKTLSQWHDFSEEPQVVEDTNVETQFGQGLLRVFFAKKGSLMAKVTISQDSKGPKPEKFDTHVAVLVVKQGSRFICAQAQDDYLETNAATPPLGPFDPVPKLKESLRSFFATMAVKQ